jgi:hypothetical protein
LNSHFQASWMTLVDLQRLVDSLPRNVTDWTPTW